MFWHFAARSGPGAHKQASAQISARTRRTGRPWAATRWMEVCGAWPAAGRTVELYSSHSAEPKTQGGEATTGVRLGAYK
eukprot:3813383-Prymnesium_polylepis.2